MSFMPIRGGTRGGKDQFEWDDVKADKHRENYLGHSLMAPVGRWQKGKDLTWYNKNSKVMGQKEILKAEIAAVKQAEEDAMAAALGLKPKSLQTGSVSKQELAEVCRRQSVDEKEEEGQEERMSGLGFMKWSHRHSSQSAATGAAMFESRPVHERESRQMVPPSSSSSGPPPPAPPVHQSRLEKKLWIERPLGSSSKESSSRGNKKDKKKKRKKEKSKKHTKKKDREGDRKRREASSDLEEEEKSRHHQHHQQRRRHDSSSRSSSEDSEEDKDLQRKQRKRHITTTNDSDSDNKRKRKKRRREERLRPGAERDGGRTQRKTKERTSRHRHDSSTD